MALRKQAALWPAWNAPFSLSFRRHLCSRKEAVVARIAALDATRPTVTPFTDSFKRQHTYLRISITERCNLRCLYCMPEEGVELTPDDRLLKNDEILRLVRLFAARGVNKVRITGGEPTIRKDLVQLIGAIREVEGINEVGITSNGIVLGRKLADLVAAGLTHLNISLDTLDRDKFTLMTRRNGFDKVTRCIEAAERLLPRVKINTVVMRGMNHEEVPDFVALTRNRNLDVRFIEFMPFGGNKFSTKRFIGYKELLKLIETRFPDNVVRLTDAPNDTSKAFAIEGYKGRFGFITSMTENFCSTCNRLRLTADGNLKVCLHGAAEVNLLRAMRDGASDEQLSEVISAAVLRKKKQHAVFRHRKPPASAESTDDSHWRMTPKSFLQVPQIASSSSSSSMFTPISNVPMRFYSLPSTKHYHQVRYFSSFSPVSNCPRDLSHLDEQGRARQVDVSHKSETLREAEAECEVHLTPEIVQLIEERRNAKGDVLCVARIAGIQAAKATGHLIPLAHPLPCLSTTVSFEFRETTLHIRSCVRCRASTGVEMEALTAASLAALTVYDMCKAASHHIRITNLHLVRKMGGRSSFSSSDPPPPPPPPPTPSSDSSA